MASNKGTSPIFKSEMSLLTAIIILILFFGLKKDGKVEQVKKPVTVAKVTKKTEVANRVVRDDHTESNAVTMVTVASKKQRESELRKQIAEAMNKQR